MCSPGVTNSGTLEDPKTRSRSVYRIEYCKYLKLILDLHVCTPQWSMMPYLVKLDKRAVEFFRELEPGKYEPFIEPDGKV